MYVYFFSFVALYLFAGSIEGSLNYSSLEAAFYTMFITLTTSNFPNAMLPGYGVNRLVSFFFIFYLVMGLFILMNLLLAVIYTKYQDREVQLLDMKNE